MHTTKTFTSLTETATAAMAATVRLRRTVDGYRTDDGYRVTRVEDDGALIAWKLRSPNALCGEIVRLREVREAIAAHRASGGRTWYCRSV